MFKSLDTDNNGIVTLEELRTGLPKLGSKISEAEIRQLMEAVSLSQPATLCQICVFPLQKTKVRKLMVFSFRLIWMEMDQLITWSLYQPQCI